ncbi:nucleoside-triphosphatase [Novosphingobium sp.]|uniref:nucleoside-triphosphatase n=1 Tax=Novosphingobium sp. TaxID=1874826 RepID=UPI0025F7E9FE|nr:nucleoside-triphosphatase [Novosphingobium sp.]MCC6925711.1 hypothetical protein [Novosphingobium sp.]
MNRLWTLIWPENLDAAVALIVALAVTVYAVLGGTKAEYISAAMLLTLSLIAFGLLKDRVARSKQQQSLDIIIGSQKILPADRFFKSKSPEDDVIRSAHSSIIMIQETGSLVTEHSQAGIIDFVNRGGSLKLVVSSPSPLPALNLAFRNENLQSDSSILKRADLFLSQMSYISSKVGPRSENITVRYSEYDIGYTSTVSDGRHPSFVSKGIVRIAGFRIPFAKKLDFEIDSEFSPRVVSHFCDEFDTLFESCSKFILLSGSPRSGKTTIINRLIDQLRSSNQHVYSVVSREIMREGERAGFEIVINGDEGTTRPFALRKEGAQKDISGILNYDFETAVWDEIADDVRRESKGGKIIILDEIGEMQISSSRFKDAISELLKDSASTVIATISVASNPFLQSVKEHYRTNIVQLSEANRDAVMDSLLSEVAASVRRASFLDGQAQ